MSNKPSLYNAAKQLSYLIERIDNTDDLTNELISEFSNSKLDLSEAIDRRRYVMSECASRIDTAKKMILDIREHVKRLEKVQQKIKSTTMSAMLINPDVSYKDTLGREIKIKQGPPKLQIDLDIKKITIDNCLDSETAAQEGITEYVNLRTYYVLDTEKIKEDLTNEVEITWASITYSDYLKGL